MIFYVEMIANKSEFDKLMSLGLAANEDIDTFQIKSIVSMTDYLNRGALMDITDIVPEYAPNLLEVVNAESWKSCYDSNGRLWALPQEIVPDTSKCNFC